MIEKKLVEILDPIVEQIVTVEKKVDAIQLTPGPAGAPGTPGADGRDGVDADPELVAKRLAEDEAFRAALKGDPGLPGAPGEPGKDADVAEVAEFLAKAHSERLRGLPGADGQNGAPGADASPEDVAAVLATKHVEVLRGLPGQPGKDGEKGADGNDGNDGVGIKSLEQDDDGTLHIILDNDETVQVELPRGEKGDPGERGKDGNDGLGLETKAWEPGIYREGCYVTAEIGRVYKAARDTNGEPGKSDDWERIGSAGFAWTGLKKEDRAYQNGDLYIDGGSAFIFWNGKGRIFSQRGQKGDAGPKGADGKDGTSIIAVKADNSGFHMAFSDGSVLTADVEGLDDYLDTKAHIKLMNWLDAEAQTIRDEGGITFRAFHGQYSYGRSYAEGDVVAYNKALWIAKRKTRTDFDMDEWSRMLSGGGGGSAGMTMRQLADVYHKAAPLLGEMPIWSYPPGSSSTEGQFFFKTPNAHIKSWDSVVNWEAGSVVYHNGQLWRAIFENHNVEPAHEEGKVTLFIKIPGEPSFGIVPMTLGPNQPPSGEQPPPPSKYAYHVQYVSDTNISIWKFVYKGLNPITGQRFGEWEGRPWQCIVWRGLVPPPASPPGTVMVWLYGTTGHAPVLGQQKWAPLDISSSLSTAPDVDAPAPKDNMILVYSASEHKWKAVDGKAWVTAQSTTP